MAKNVQRTDAPPAEQEPTATAPAAQSAAHYAVVYRLAGGGRYEAEVLDLGVAAAGRTIEAARVAVREAVGLHFNGLHGRGRAARAHPQAFVEMLDLAEQLTPAAGS